MSKKKKIIVLACMIALLVTTATLNFTLSTNGILDDNSVSTVSYLTEFRNSVKSTRNEQLLQIDEILSKSSNDSEEYASAVSLKLKIAEALEIEPRLEFMIKALGFEDVAVTKSVSSDSYRVHVKDANLDLDDAIRIYSIFKDEVNASPENVIIFPIS